MLQPQAQNLLPSLTNSSTASQQSMVRGKTLKRILLITLNYWDAKASVFHLLPINGSTSEGINAVPPAMSGFPIPLAGVLAVVADSGQNQSPAGRGHTFIS
jgi:hypothetical protein